MTDPYFGYESSQNQQLRDLKTMGRHMGEDVTHYPKLESGGGYVEPTIDWDKPLTGERAKRSNALFANDSIEYIRKRILAQNPNAVDQLADRWKRVGQVFDDLRQRVYRPAVDLKNGGKSGEGWTGAGADAFLARGPGATLKSIDDWREAAVVNEKAAVELARVIREHHAKINQLWDEYEAQMVTYSHEYMDMNFIDGKNTDIETLPKEAQDKYVTYLKSREIEFSRRAQKIQYGMAQGYWTVMSTDMAGSTATRYEGPTNAVQADGEFLKRAMMGGMPSIASAPNAPKINAPNLSVPNGLTVGPTATLNPPAALATGPQLTAPNKQGLNAFTATPPTVTPPTLTPPVVPSQLGLTAVPPVLPPGLASGPATTGVPPAVRTPPSVNSPSNLMNNLPGQGKTPGVLRAAPNASTVQSPGQTPSMPSLPKGGQPPQAQVKAPGTPSNSGGPPGMPGRGAPTQGASGRGAPSLPPGARGTQGPDGSLPGAPRTAGTGQPNQFAGPSGSSPSSPVLRSPRTEQPPQLPGMPGRGAAATPSPGGRPGTPGATSPVLGRPRGSVPVDMPQASAMTPPPGNPALSPPRAPTARPVVGRTPLPTTSGRPAAESSSGVLRSSRQAGTPAYEGQIGSRKRAEADRQLTVEQEFDKIRQLLRQEDAWTVETPGGGVLDSAPTKPVTPATEPKPRVGG